MNHLTDDDLVLHHYNEPLDPRLQEHLASCAECQSAAGSLQRTLAIVDSEDLPEPPSTYEAELWSRLQWSMRKERSGSRKRFLASIAAAAAILLVVFLAGRYTAPVAPVAVVSSQPALAIQPASRSSNAVLTRAAGEHLDRSLRLLIEVENHQAGGAMLRNGTQSARDLVASNRLYRQSATGAGASELALLLEDLEPILVELVHSERDLSSEDLAALQRRIEKRELLFKLRIISSTLREQQRTEAVTPSSTGRTL